MELSVDTVLYLLNIGPWALLATDGHFFFNKTLYHQGKYVASLIDTSTFTYRMVCQEYFFF